MSTRRIAAVIGSPVTHSLSPAIHQAAFDAAGVSWTYTAFDITDAAAALSAMRLLGLAGLSVTMPLKEDVAQAVDRLDPAARVLNSVNTVSWDGGELVGSSTDGAGFVASLAAAGVAVDGAEISVIGAGGAARSVIDALGRAGAADITVLNRTRDRAEYAASLSKAASVGIVSDITRADIVINATSVGMGVSIDDATDLDMACDPALLRSGQVVADLVYHPLETAWIRAAADIGATTVDGLGMLVQQAALQQLQWLGTMPDTTAMRIAAEAELARR
ncbi:shikimate dehydrogenase [Ilumatobacter sp.]|uniref:shikimate dehydrogenase n=1 Tax=Ilumatobacter sp. TaxID=1967498 RepID=UPI003094CBAF